MRWTLHRFARGPKFVSQRIAMLPYKGAALRQVVVRLRSRQSLARLVSSGKNKPEEIVKGTGDEKEVSEYLVLQRRVMKNQEGPDAGADYSKDMIMQVQSVYQYRD
ncbi:MAG: hypothetical protein LQ338_004971 [Usnochroma carphineum]|nr:MAG: hypothetical protein LQ338_004971 [Usnochroma carphineum]